MNARYENSIRILSDDTGTIEERILAAKDLSNTPDQVAVDALSAVRARVHETFGKVALAMIALPRYRHLSVADLAPVLLEPLIRDRVALASKGEDGDAMAGVVLWASVSEEVDAKIREQIKAGVFPVRLSAADWTSGEINWLLDVIAPSTAMATTVLANMKQVVKSGDLRVHPVVTKLVEKGALEKLGATAQRQRED